MNNSQQNETLKYFTSNADDWKQKAENKGEQKVNIIKQRNDFVLTIVKETSQAKKFLDIGCGTGDLVRDVASSGLIAKGIDFASTMIEIANQKVDEKAMENISFECCSVFDFDFKPSEFDIISANGFIEYISEKELKDFFNLSYKALNQGGKLIVGSRNRLFNLFSQNIFTQKEFDGEDKEALMEESIALNSGKKLQDIQVDKIAKTQSENMKHNITGIDVSTRFQYTPFQLIKMLEKEGFSVEELYPAHIHTLPPLFKENHMSTHTAIANTLQESARGELGFIPISSTFMLVATKN